MMAEHRIVLVGGGHSHVQVLRAFARQPEPLARLTLVSDSLEAPYSGMLPGHIAGLYSREAMHIDLAALAARCGRMSSRRRRSGSTAGAPGRSRRWEATSSPTTRCR